MNKKLIPFFTIIAVLFFCLSTCISTCSGKRSKVSRQEREKREERKDKQETIEEIENQRARFREDSINAARKLEMDSINAARQLVIDSIEQEMHILSHDSILTADVQVRNAGSAKTLSGKICVYSFFAHLQNNQWSDEEIASYSKKVIYACDWLRKQAALWSGNQMEDGSYNTLPEFTCIFSDAAPVILPSLPKYGITKYDAQFRLCDKIAKENGFFDMYSINEWAKEKCGCEQLVVLFFYKGSGRSFCSPALRQNEGFDQYYTDYCYLFTEYEHWGSLETGSVVHEMLHAFGAWDLYPVTPRMKKLASRAELLFPDSPMIQGANIESKTIDEINAFLVGLHDNPKAYYQYFDAE